MVDKLLPNDPAFWAGNGAVRVEIEAIAKQALEIIDPEEKIVIRALREAAEKFASGQRTGSKSASNARRTKRARR
jgi:hypothetical protein